MMEQPELETSCPGADDGPLARTRSFKSKQLVRSAAIREAASPPRSASPPPPTPPPASAHAHAPAPASAHAPASNGDRADDDASSHSDKCSVISSDRKCEDRKKQVEIQITCGAWEEGASGQRLRARRWLGHRHHSDSSRDLLSHAPRRTCVCGACACPHCRGRRSKQPCPTKQDSGIACSEDCPDCPDCADACADHHGQNGDGTKRTGSFDAEEQGFYCRCPDRKEKPKSFSLTRTDSAEDKMEPTGPELVNFIKETLNKNPRDRMTLLRIEKDLHALINDASRCIVRFPVMTSYGRMLVHRCAALFGLAHHLDHAHKNAVLVSKSGTSGGRLPCTSFRQWCTTVFPRSPPRRHDDTLAKSILKREGGGALGGPAGAAPRSKSLEQRERDYERVRRRIFSSDNCTQDENQWPWLNSGPVKLLTPETGRNKLLKVQSLEAGGGGARGPVAKSHSFGGYSDPPQRLLSRQGDLASSSWRLSPSSSGYKTLSLRSTDSVTPSPTGGASPEPTSEAGGGAGGGAGGAGGGALVWAVTDLSAVPVGAVVIHPQTGRALTNPDGSLYHFHPDNPPPLYDAEVATHEDKAEMNGDKKRGKLEKQHSFIDHECECAGEEHRGKCCCDCRRRQPARDHAEKTSTKEIQTGSIPSSPAKNRYTKPPTPDVKTEKPSEPIQRAGAQQVYDSPSRSFDSAHYESPKRVEQRYEVQNSNSPKTFEPANQRMTYEAPAQRSFEATNQRPTFENQRSYDSARQFAPKECEVQQCYVQPMRSEESPMSGHNYAEEAKTTPVPLGDHNMRPVSLTNMSYPVLQQPTYPYPCRIQDPQLPAPMYQLQPEEPKMAPDNTFRIDPSYPYAADFSACGACEPQPRPYTVPYGVEMGAQYLPNVLLPPAPPAQPQHYPQYQEALQWGQLQPPLPLSPAAPKLMLHDVYPLVYPPLYPNPPYGVVYPAAPLHQMIPQPYPMCQPVYPLDKPAERRPAGPRRGSLAGSLPASQRATPHADERAPATAPADPDIAIKIQQIKDQMAQVSTRDRQWERPRRRNSGSGLLGSYPAPVAARQLGRSPSEEAQLSSAARAIVNSIRSMQAKNNTYPDRRGPEPREQYRRPRAPAPAAPAPPADRPRRAYNPLVTYRPPYLLRQMSPGTWCRRSPGTATPVMNHNQPRRPHPDTRSGRR